MKTVAVRPGEGRALVGSFLYFLFLLTSYYILRPIRDDRGIAAGVGNLKWLFTATFVSMLVVTPVWSALLARVPRAKLLPIAYRFFLANLLVFYVLFQRDDTKVMAAKVFFVWLSVFNYLAVSVFWSFMADIFRPEQGRRLFGFIAAGGSAGAILGPLATSLLVGRIGLPNLLLLSAVLLEGAAQCIRALVRGQPSNEGLQEPVGGDALSGVKTLFASPYLLAIAGYTLFASLAGTFGYRLQAGLVEEAKMDAVARTTLFARMDLVTNALSALLQALLAGRLLASVGLRTTLALLPPISTAGFAALAAAPTLMVSSALLVLRRAVGFGIANPAVQVLYTPVPRDEKYKSKSFIDTVVARGGDMANAWAVDALFIVGLAVPQVALATVPIGALWLWLSLALGRVAEKRTRGV